MAARAFGKHGVLTQQFHTKLETVHRRAIFAHAHIASGHAFDRAVVVVQHLSPGEARENLHAQRFGLLGHPFGERTQADDVVAMVVGKRWQDHIGHPKAGFFAQKDIGVVSHWLLERRASRLPVWDQLA